MQLNRMRPAAQPPIPQQHDVEPTSASLLPRRLRRTAACAVMLGSLSVTGCQSVSGSATVSQVRIIDASPDAPGLDIYEGSSALAYNLGFGNVTSYIPINPSTYTFSADTTGTRQVLTSASGTFSGSAQYTVLIGNVAASLQELILKDQSGSAPGGQVSFRFLDQATAVGAVDIYLVPSGSLITAVSPVLTGQTLNGNSGYLNVAAGAYTIVIYAAGTTPTATTVPAYSGSVVTYSTGSARTILLLDKKIVSTPSVQVVTADDYDSPSATS